MRYMWLNIHTNPIYNYLNIVMDWCVLIDDWKETIFHR